jgi:hypothetical protein
VTAPFEIMVVDLVGLLITTPCGNRFAATRFGMAEATKMKMATEVARRYVFNVGLVYGYMGSEWCNALMDEICRLLGIVRHTTSADNSAGVAIDEHAHLEIKNALCALNMGDAWDMVPCSHVRTQPALHQAEWWYAL